MNIKKILEFSEEEVGLLVSAGKFLADINDKKLSSAFDEYSDEAKKLIRALHDVINRDGILSAVEMEVNE